MRLFIKISPYGVCVGGYFTPVCSLKLRETRGEEVAADTNWGLLLLLSTPVLMKQADFFRLVTFLMFRSRKMSR